MIEVKYDSIAESCDVNMIEREMIETNNVVYHCIGDTYSKRLVWITRYVAINVWYLIYKLSAQLVWFGLVWFGLVWFQAFVLRRHHCFMLL